MFSAMSEFCCSTIIICWQFVSDVFHKKLLKLIWRIWVNLHRIKCFWIERIINMCSVQKGFCTETRNIKVNCASVSIFWCKLACDRIIFLSDILPCIFCWQLSMHPFCFRMLLLLYCIMCCSVILLVDSVSCAGHVTSPLCFNL